MAPADPAAVRRFVRDVLGCACPDEVFERIEARRDDARMATLVIGDRLLIRILDIADPDDLLAGLTGIVLDGMEERDARRLNRFRLVVIDPGFALDPGALSAVFETVPFLDDRTHLHLVEADEIPNV